MTLTVKQSPTIPQAEKRIQGQGLSYALRSELR